MKRKAFIAFIACPFISLSCMYHGPHDSAKGTTEAEGKATDRRLLRTSPLAVFPSQKKNKKVLVLKDKWEVCEPKPRIKCDDTNKAMPYSLSPF